MFLLLLACVPAAVYGLRFDGSMPMTTELSAVGAAFPGAASDELSLLDTTGVGLQGRQRIGRDVAVQLSGGLAVASLDSDPTGVIEIEVQGRVLREAPVTLSVRGGVDAYGQAQGESLMFGVHGGAVVSRNIGANLRPYAGVTVNPVYNPGDRLYPWLQYGGGISWRPPLDAGTRGFFAVEASGYRGFGADVLNDEDIVTWGMMVQVGASFGSGNED